MSMRHGADAVVASLWQVEDESASRLMSDFVANLGAGKGKAAALREAQLSMIQLRREHLRRCPPLHLSHVHVSRPRGLTCARLAGLRSSAAVIDYGPDLTIPRCSCPVSARNPDTPGRHGRADVRSVLE